MDAGQAAGASRDAPLAVATAVVALAVLLLLPVVGRDYVARDRPVLQVHQGGGLGGYSRTRLLLWSSGRAAFMAPDLVLRETRIEPAVVSDLVRAADVLLDLPDYLAGGRCGDDVGSTFFAVDGGRGRKGVEVCGMGLDRPWPDEQNAPAQARLRSLWRRLAAVLPVDDDRAEHSKRYPHFVPDEVVVQISPVDPDSESIRRDPEVQERVRALVAPVARRWPGELVGHVVGQQARGASDLALSARASAALAPEGGRGDLFLLNGMVHGVAVRPVLPTLALLSSTRSAGRLGGVLPHHPLATAYNAPGAPYRFEDVSHSSVARWYRWAMPFHGWRLVRERRDGPGSAEAAYVSQVWVRARRPAHAFDALVLLVFQPGQLQMRPIYVNGDVPERRWDALEGCAAPECAGARDATPAQLGTWYREHLGYLGWREAAPDTFRKGQRELRLAYGVFDGRTTVNLVERRLSGG